MISAIRSRAANILRAAAPLILLAAFAAILVLFPPEQYWFYPQCPIYRLFHLQCPGCGTTRALAALLQGHLIEAFRFNALTTFLVPPAGIYGAICYRRFLQRKPFVRPQPPSAAIYSALAVAIIFAIVRDSKGNLNLW